MLHAVANGGGTMAQFNIPELGGNGQWMQGGMTMVGDMFNYGLQSTVNNLCNELSNLLQSQTMFEPQPANRTTGGINSGNWWPAELGIPTSSGSQNNLRYAYFAPQKRLVLDYHGAISVYDTLGHQISGFSQQQGGGDSIQFTSQYGLVDTLRLPLISGPGTLHQSATTTVPEPPVVNTMSEIQPTTTQSEDDIFKTIEKLAGLLEKGILTQEEFDAKKTELLKRL